LSPLGNSARVEIPDALVRWAVERSLLSDQVSAEVELKGPACGLESGASVEDLSVSGVLRMIRYAGGGAKVGIVVYALAMREWLTKHPVIADVWDLSLAAICNPRWDATVGLGDLGAFSRSVFIEGAAGQDGAGDFLDHLHANSGAAGAWAARHGVVGFPVRRFHDFERALG
jgi:hypothetical protein